MSLEPSVSFTSGARHAFNPASLQPATSCSGGGFAANGSCEALGSGEVEMGATEADPTSSLAEVRAAASTGESSRLRQAVTITNATRPNARARGPAFQPISTSVAVARRRRQTRRSDQTKPRESASQRARSQRGQARLPLRSGASCVAQGCARRTARSSTMRPPKNSSCARTFEFSVLSRLLASLVGALRGSCRRAPWGRNCPLLQ